MKLRLAFTISLLALVLANCATPTSNMQPPAAWLQDIGVKSRLVAEMHGMRAADQFERNKIIALLQDQSMPAAQKETSVKELGDMITRNDTVRTARLKEIFKTTDLMQMSQIDASTASAAFMIIIHAENDLEFQKSQLPVAFELAKKGILSNQEYATLADKIAVKEGRPQAYGSQYKCVNGSLQIIGTHDRAAIIAARTEIGLEPLDDYLKQGAALYGCGTR